MVDSPKQRTVRTSKAEACVSEMARREADRHARRIPWQRLLEARQQYIEWNAFSLWARAIAVAEGQVPAWLAKVLEEHCPGLLESDRTSEITHQDPPLYRRILEWFESNALAQAKDEGWLRAVTFYAVRDPVYVRDCAYWQHCEAQWKRQRPSAYPSFEEWRRSSEQSADEVLDAFEMADDKRRIIKPPGRLVQSASQQRWRNIWSGKLSLTGCSRCWSQMENSLTPSRRSCNAAAQVSLHATKNFATRSLRRITPEGGKPFSSGARIGFSAQCGKKAGLTRSCMRRERIREASEP